MSLPNTPDPLRALLRRWAEGQKPDDTEIESLRGRVNNLVWETALFETPLTIPSSRRIRWAGRAAWFVAGAAAAVLLVFCFLRPEAQYGPGTLAQQHGERLPPWVKFDRTELSDKSKLFAELKEVFDGRLAWAAETDGQVELGLLKDSESQRGAMPIAVRLAVLTRAAGTAEWKPVWGTDLMTQDRQLVELSPDKTGGARLRMRTQRLPDGAIAVDTDLAIEGKQPIRSTFSGVQQGGVPRRVFSLQNGDVEYRVYQTIALLAAN